MTTITGSTHSSAIRSCTLAAAAAEIGAVVYHPFSASDGECSAERESADDINAVSTLIVSFARTCESGRVEERQPGAEARIRPITGADER
jgi:delta-aminolevulinic acid dehydratase/porphobilinogen synthase